VKGLETMREISIESVKEWPIVNLIKGIRLTYKGRSMYFPKVYLGPSEMGDFDRAKESIDYKEAKEAQKETIATRKAMCLCSRVKLCDGYADDKEQIKIQADYALRERARRKIEHKIEDAEDEVLIETLKAELEETPELPKPTFLFPTEEMLLSFGVSNLSGEGTIPVDNIRIMQAYQTINFFETESIEDFLQCP